MVLGVALTNPFQTLANAPTADIAPIVVGRIPPLTRSRPNPRSLTPPNEPKADASRSINAQETPVANKKTQKKQAGVNMAGKPSRQEILDTFQPVAELASKSFNGLVALADFLITKGVYTREELNLFIAGRNSQAAAQHPAPQTLEGVVNDAQATNV